MVRIEATLLQLKVIGLRPRGEGKKAPEERVIAGFFALLQEWLGMIRVFHILEPLVPSGMAGNELVPQIDAQSIGVGLERQSVAGILGGDGIAVGLQGNAKLPRGS